MKQILVVAIALIATINSFGQAQQVVNKTSGNPVKLVYEKDEFSDKEYLMTDKDLLVSDDGKKGFILYPRFKKEKGEWVYSTIGGTAAQIGSCYENDKVEIIFEDGSKFQMVSWRDFNCKGDIGFDLYGKFREQLSKPMKAIRFTNGRTYDSFTKNLTSDFDKNYFINAFKALDEYNQK